MTTRNELNEQLFEEAKNGYKAAARALFEKGADLEATDELVMTALKRALKEGHKEAARVLLAASLLLRTRLCGLDRGNDMGGQGTTDRLIDVANRQHGEMRQRILDGLLSGGRGSAEGVLKLVAAGANIEANDGEPLREAARWGSWGTVRALLEAGANVNAADKSGWTALMLASMYGHSLVVAQLIRSGADLNATAQAFLFAGANVNTTKVTALMLARQRGHADVVKLLEAAARQRAEKPDKPSF